MIQTFYHKILEELVKQNLLVKTDTVLAICAGTTDRNAFKDNGFTKVTISNLDYHGGVKDYDPFPWEFLDAENIDREDSSVDWVAVHAGLHHCASPHKALCEMVRVSRKGVIVFEARDSFFVRLSTKLGLTPLYEFEAIALTDGKYGGYRNTSIPNYIFRWTEREVEKTVNSYAPEHIHDFHYFHDFRVPTQRLTMSTNPLKRITAKFFLALLPIIKIIIPKQGNVFAFAVTKHGRLQPWLQHEEDLTITPNLNYIQKYYDPKKYTR